MGLLDDAIREHLDLKRRRGADPAEIERAEREALGPIRRPSEADDGDFLEDVDDIDFDEEDGHGGVPDLERGLEPDQEDEGGYADWHDREPSRSSKPDASGSPRAHDEETAEYDLEAEPEPAEHRGGNPHGDVLEDTPEFLQDAPEHDRLWFEQRPPRDFDFDS